MIPWIAGTDDFPPLELAFTEPNGLLCAGGDLSPQRILQAYRHGIFPWYSKGEPILWWSPNPRMVLVPSEFRISHSLRKTLRKGNYCIKLDDDFPAIIRACAKAPRKGQSGTWITTEMQSAYSTLFELGYAHSVGVYIDDKLAGGLYGLAIGKMFYGESMFSHATDASKIAVAHLAHFLETQGFGLIDCQMNTPHLASLGACEIPRRQFIARLRELITLPPLSGRWPVNGGTRICKKEAVDVTPQ